MFLPNEQTYNGRYSLHAGCGSHTVDVCCTSLDDIVAENGLDVVDVLKIDCQGSEYEILYRASPETLRKIRNILLECEIFDQPREWSIGRAPDLPGGQRISPHDEQPAIVRQPPVKP